MAIKVIAQRREVKLGKNPGKKFVMRPDLYIPIQEKKVFAEASTHSGISAGVIKAAWDAAGEVIRTWATEGHSVPLPGLGTMRFGVRSKAVAELEDVKANLITTRRIIFTPNVDVKDELKNTAIQITCLDEDGNVLKRVTSGDSGEIEDNENGGESENGNENGGSSNSGSGSQNSGTGTVTPSGGGSQNSGSQNQGGNSGSESGTEGDYRLVIYKYGNGTSTVTDDNEQEINSNDNVHSGSNVNISVVPVEGKEPIAKVNGNRITLTENDGTYTGSFQMPTKGTVLEINSEPDDLDFGDMN
jgi:predicted histone-like DNA-binding protein